MRAHFEGTSLVRSSRLRMQSKHTYNDPCLCIDTSIGWENRPTPRLSCSPAGPSPSSNKLSGNLPLEVAAPLSDRRDRAVAHCRFDDFV